MRSPTSNNAANIPTTSTMELRRRENANLKAQEKHSSHQSGGKSSNDVQASGINTEVVPLTQAQLQAPATDENDDGGYDPSKEYNCPSCTECDAFDDMVECSTCKEYFHFSCAGVTSEIKDVTMWICIRCKPSYKSASILSVHSTTTSEKLRNELELQKLEELNRLEQQKIDKQLEFTKKKFDMLQAFACNDNKSTRSCFSRLPNIDKEKATSSWVNQNRISCSDGGIFNHVYSTEVPCIDQSCALKSTSRDKIVEPDATRDEIIEPDVSRLNTKMIMHKGGHPNQGPLFRFKPGRSLDEVKSRSLSWMESTKTQHLINKIDDRLNVGERNLGGYRSSMIKPSELRTAKEDGPSVKFSRNRLCDPPATSNNADWPRNLVNSTWVAPQEPIYHSSGRNRYDHLPTSSMPLNTTPPNYMERRSLIDLPEFTGNPAEWCTFITAFTQTTERCAYTNVDNAIRLRQCLKGKAFELIEGLLMFPEDVPEAIDTLTMHFGRPDIQMNYYLKKIRAMPAVEYDRLDHLINYATLVRNMCAMIRSSMPRRYLRDHMSLQELVDKLPPHVRLEWGRHTRTITDPDILMFSQWLTEEAWCASKVTVGVTLTSHKPSTPSGSESKFVKRNFSTKGFVHHNAHQEIKQPNVVKVNVSNSKSNDDTTKSKTCPLCSLSEHKLDRCELFLKLGKDERWETHKKHNACRKCLGLHSIRYCRSRRVCGIDGCDLKHHPLLHRDGITNKLSSESNSPGTSKKLIPPQAKVNCHSEHDHPPILFRIVPVRLYGPNSCVETLAFLDEGSSVTLLDQEIANQLNLEGPMEDLCLRWTGDVFRTEENSRRVTLSISGRPPNSRQYKLSGVRTVQKLDLPVQSLKDDQIEGFSYLQDLPIDYYQNEKPKVLIGLDNYKLGLTLDIREGGWHEPMATKTRLGWSVYGPTGVENHLGVASNSVLHMCECNNDATLHQLVKQYFSLENVGVRSTSKKLESKEDERARTIMRNTTKLVGDHYETGLLWRYDDVALPNSYPMALRRLECLERKLVKDPELAAIINTKIDEYLTKGYARKMTTDERTGGSRIWYLPIFTVRNPNKPSKVRIVWDAAAKVGGMALNSVLLTGPDLLTSLPAVLHRFRENRIAICGDIAEMFHRINIIEQDQQSQRFLWRNCDINRTPDTYIMAAMTFGATCSPSSAQFVKNLNAERFAHKFPRAVDAIKSNHYVDDYLDGAMTEHDVIDLARTVRAIHASGGFRITNWLSNSKKVLDALGESPSPLKTMKIISNKEVPTEKVLGLWWNPESDDLTFFLNPDRVGRELLDGSVKPTKRQVLRTLMTIFDPLGLISFILVFVKILLQEIWRDSIGWDEKISDEQFDKWMSWVKVLHTIDKVKIPRCYSIISSRRVQLHVFTDASENAYATVAYFRFENDEVDIALVGSKTKVAPQKPLSVPRLELQGAILGSRFAQCITKAHTFQITKRIFWTDSRNVLCWIRSDARKFRQFVALRIGELLESTEVSEWRWIPSALNVADDATKWTSPPIIDNTNRWFCGPPFLKLDETQWPDDDAKQQSSECELRVHQVVSKKIPDIETPDPHRIPEWTRLINAVGYVMRFVVNLRRKVKGLPKIVGPITSTEREKAMIQLYRRCQHDAFSNEIWSLSSNPPVPIEKVSPIYIYSPYLDDHGVLRVHGRIDAIEGVDVAVKRPIILPSRHRITSLIVRHYHRIYRHRHDETVINEIRQIFVIPRLRSVLKGVRADCQHCRILRASPRPPRMGPLPVARLSPFTRPFTFVGVDYFGPIEVSIGRRREKRWGCLFTCLTLRAIHLEVAHSLSTDSCILALRRFMCRRGQPNEIFSDQGTNFRGANNALVAALQEIDTDKLMDEFSNIKWNFIPPMSPHMGGSWERLVRTVKSILVDVMPEKCNDELLYSLFVEIENIINSRPLTFIPITNIMDEALTPNHFLLGSSSGVKPFSRDGPDCLISRKNWRISQHVADCYWKRWVSEYLPTLTRRSKWFQPSKPIQIGDVVIICDNAQPRNTWPKGIIIDVQQSADGQVRSAVVQTADKRLFTRPAVKLAVLDLEPKKDDKPAEPTYQGGVLANAHT